MKRHGTCAGYTLLELVIAALLMTALMGSLALFGGRSADALGSSTSQTELDAQLRRTLSRMVEELLPSGLSVITPEGAAPGGSSVLNYRTSQGPVNGRNTWGASHRLAFAYETGELDDGLDNNKNGLVDEGVVEWTRNVGTPEEQRLTLCHGVRELDQREQPNGLDDDGDGLIDEPGFVFERRGNVLRLSLTLERLGADRRLVAGTLQTVLQPRNR